MHREPIIQLLNVHRGIDREEETMRREMLDFVRQEPMCFERALLKGHLTGAAWIVDQKRQNVAMVLHKKLGRWLQPGGHADGDPDLLAVAIKEAEEETGLPVRPVSADIFDVDIHIIPERGELPAHYHYDVRFLLEADRDAPLIISHESRDLAWIPISEVEKYNSDRSIMRLVDKIRGLEKG